MEHLYNEIVFNIELYQYNNTYEEAKSLMWEDITKFLVILMKNDQVAVIRDDDTDIIVIQYNHDEHKESWGSLNPYWITDEDYDVHLYLKEHEGVACEE